MTTVTIIETENFFISINQLVTKTFGDFPGGPVVKNLCCNAGDVGSIPGWGN